MAEQRHCVSYCCCNSALSGNGNEEMAFYPLWILFMHFNNRTLMNSLLSVITLTKSWLHFFFFLNLTSETDNGNWVPRCSDAKSACFTWGQDWCGSQRKGKSTATKTCHLKIHYFLEDDQRQAETYVGSLDTLCDCSQYWYSLLLAFYCMLDHIGTGLNQFKWSTCAQCQWNVILLHLIWEYDFYFEEGQQGKGHTSHCVNMKYFKRKGYFYDWFENKYWKRRRMFMNCQSGIWHIRVNTVAARNTIRDHVAL